MRLSIICILILAALTKSIGQQVEVTITNIDFKKGGTVRVALFDNADSFLTKPLKIREVKVKGSESILYFEIPNIKEFAISVYQDTNNNKELDTGFMGIPNEPYGFSNNVMGAFGPPSFDKAKVMVNDSLKATINLR